MPRPPRAIHAYDVLGVPMSASAEQIRAAYKRLAFDHHPDRNPAARREGHRIREINEAYAILRNPLSRRLHDAMLAGVASESASAPDAGRGSVRGGLHLHPLELRLLAAALRFSLMVFRGLRRPARSPLFWLAGGALAAGVFYFAWPFSAALLVVGLLSIFALQALLMLYLLLRFVRPGR